MKFVSIDIETTGLNPEHCQVIEFGAVFVDNFEIKKKFRVVISHPKYSGDAYALSLNKRIFDEIVADNKITTENVVDVDNFIVAFVNWLTDECGYEYKDNNRISIIAAGKNFAAFDLQFLKRLPRWDLNIKVHHRIFDPAILYFDPTTDEEIPNLDTCKIRAGLSGVVTHNAVEDAEDVANLLIHKFKPNATT